MIIHITTHMENCIRQFMDTFEQKRYGKIEDVPCETAALRSSLIKEEANEYAMAQINSTDELDAIVDSLYVVIGTNLTCNVQVVPYQCGQVFLGGKLKYSISDTVKNVTQDLDSRFPCAKIQFAGLNKLIQLLVNIAAWRGYNLRGAFDAVHAANLSKLWSQQDWSACKTLGATAKKKGDRYLVTREDGKVIKPSTFKSPELSSFLASNRDRSRSGGASVSPP